VEHVTGSVSLKYYSDIYRDFTSFWGKLKSIGGEENFLLTPYCRDVRNKAECQG